jgi:hypothetical protein
MILGYVYLQIQVASELQVPSAPQVMVCVGERVSLKTMPLLHWYLK